MTAPLGSPRCPECGNELGAAPSAGAPSRWIDCPRCHFAVPSLAPSELPALYSWEVYDDLYPAQPTPVRPRRPYRRPVVPALLAVAIVAVALAGTLGYLGIVGTGPAPHLVSGYVTRADGTALSGALVTVTEEGGAVVAHTTDLGGAFSFAGVPTGGIRINVTASGYAPVEVITFVSSIYDAGTQGLVISLSAGGNANGSTVALSPFSSLEDLLTAVGSMAVILVAIGMVAAVAAARLRRQDRPALGAVAGAGGVATPLAVLALSLAAPLPWLLLTSAGIGALGAFTLALCWIELIQIGGTAGIT